MRARRRGQRGAVWLETLVLLALVLAVGVALRGFGGTLAQSFACAGERIRNLSANGGLVAPACGSERAPAAGADTAHAAPGARFNRNFKAAARRTWVESTNGGPSSPEAPERPRGSAHEQEDDGGVLGWIKGAAGMAGSVAFELSPLSDVATLLDPNASLLDKGTAAVGLLPGPGQVFKWAAKAAKFANQAAGAGKTADKIKDTRKTEEATDPFAGGKKKADEDKPEGKQSAVAEECTGVACKNGTCFAAGTLVHGADGLRPIEEVREGDLLWSRSDETGELGLQRVLQRFVTPNRALLRIELDTGAGIAEELRVTPPHPFWTARGWVAAKDLTSEDEVTLISGEPARVTAAQTLELGATVYNLEVEGFHTYFVGDAGAWVHNQNAGGKPCPPAPFSKKEAEDLLKTSQNKQGPGKNEGHSEDHVPKADASDADARLLAENRPSKANTTVFRSRNQALRILRDAINTRWQDIAHLRPGDPPISGTYRLPKAAQGFNSVNGAAAIDGHFSSVTWAVARMPGGRLHLVHFSPFGFR